MNMALLITNLGFVVNSVFTLVFGIFIFVKSKRSVAGTTFLLMSLAVLSFELSHLVGINITDPALSRTVLMWNLGCIAIVCFNAHFIYAVTNTLARYRGMILFYYSTGIALIAFFLIFPDTFLLNSTPKLYFPNYYEAGKFYWVMRAYFLLIPFHFTYVLVKAYRNTADIIEKRRYRYIGWGMFFGYIIGQFPVPLVFNIPVDPILSIFTAFYVIPVGYAAVRYELADIKIVARKAVLYGVSVAGLTGLIGIANYVNGFIIREGGTWGTWLLPAISSFVAVGIGSWVWRRTRETDELKTEFISIISHKFRTPLTHIRWSTELLMNTVKDPNTLEQIQNINESNQKLIELSNALVATAEGSSANLAYSLNPLSLKELSEEVLKNHSAQIRDKHLTIVREFEAKKILIKADRERIKFAIQTLIENAIHYTPERGIIVLRIKADKKHATFQIHDNGIGLDETQIKRVFTRFYRSDTARYQHTEGVGIGLYLTKIIADRHGGKITVESPGVNKGSTFTMSLPAWSEPTQQK